MLGGVCAKQKTVHDEQRLLALYFNSSTVRQQPRMRSMKKAAARSLYANANFIACKRSHNANALLFVAA